METQLRLILGEELRRRHGFGMMEGKIKPVHVANALMREEHQQVGRMGDLRFLMAATATGESHESRLAAITQMLERNRERWGRLGEADNLRQSLLATRVLPLLRTILATDNAAYGKSPEFSSFSSPTARTVTGDASDDHTGSFVHRLWGGHEEGARLEILGLFHRLTDPERTMAEVDDLTAILIPLSDEMRAYRSSLREPEDLIHRPPCQIAEELRLAARDLQRFEEALNPNPIASLQRIVLLASLSVLIYAATRGQDRLGLEKRLVLIDASGSRDTPIATASERSVSQVLDDARNYTASIVEQLLREARDDWEQDPASTLEAVLRTHAKKATSSIDMRSINDLIDELRDSDGNIRGEFPRRVVDMLDSSGGRTLDGFLRLLGVRCGLLYPQQKNPTKRCVPTDRTLETIVVSTFDLSGRALEYRDFLDKLHQRWGMVVGGRLEDAALLANARNPVPAADLAENSERFLMRLQRIGLARKFADSVAVVGLTEADHAGH